MAKRSGKIGEVRVDITADTAKLKAGLREAEAQVKQTADTTESETQRMGKSFSFIQEAISKIIIPAIVAKTFIGLVTNLEAARAKAVELKQVFADIATQGAKINLSLSEQGLTENERALKAAARQFVAINQQLTEEANRQILAAQSASEVGFLWRIWTGGSSVQEIESGVSAALARNARQAESAAERLRVIQANATKDRAADIDAGNRLLAESLLDPVAQAAAELLRVQDEVNEELKNAETEEEKEALRRKLILVAQIASAKSAAAQHVANEERRLDEETARKKLETIEKQAQALGAAVEKALTTAFTRGFATSEAKMNRLVIAAERMIDSIERLRRRMNP